MAIPGTGSAGMEAGLSSLLEPGDTVVMCIYGYFCERMVDMASRVGANVVPLRADWGKPFPEEMLEEELKRQSNVKLVTAIHAETSTGIRQPLQDLSRLAREGDALFMVAVMSFMTGDDAGAYFAIEAAVQFGDNGRAAANLKQAVESTLFERLER